MCNRINRTNRTNRSPIHTPTYKPTPRFTYPSDGPRVPAHLPAPLRRGHGRAVPGERAAGPVYGAELPEVQPDVRVVCCGLFCSSVCLLLGRGRGVSVCVCVGGWMDASPPLPLMWRLTLLLVVTQPILQHQPTSIPSLPPAPGTRRPPRRSSGGRPRAGARRSRRTSASSWPTSATSGGCGLFVFLEGGGGGGGGLGRCVWQDGGVEFCFGVVVCVWMGCRGIGCRLGPCTLVAVTSSLFLCLVVI